MPNPTILVATWSDGIFAINGDQAKHEMANQNVRGLAPDTRGGALAILDQHALRRRAPDGEWTTLAATGFELSCCMVVRETIYVGTDDARMLRLRRDSVLEPIESFDRVAGRDTWFAGSAIVNGQRLGPPLGIRSVAANSNGAILFANVHVGGIPRSTDGGETWEPIIDINTDVHEVRGHPANPNIVAAAAAVGLCISRDAGATWTIESNGLHAPHCAAVAFAGDDILVSASVDPFSPEGRIYRRPLNDGPLTAVQGGMPEWTEGKVDTGCISVKGASIAAADMKGNVYFSQDSGQSWSRIATGLPTPSGVLTT